MLDAKTPTGMREVHFSPELAHLISLYREQHRRDGKPAGNDHFLWSGADGGPRSYSWALKKVHRAARIATEQREARGLPPPPRVTPHTLRHTYISILLLVTDNVTYVMEQDGHEDRDTTNRIYRHLIRQHHEHGAAFDQVVGQAREAFGTQGETSALWVDCGLAAA